MRLSQRCSCLHQVWCGNLILTVLSCENPWRIWELRVRSFGRIRIRISDLWRSFQANPFSDDLSNPLWTRIYRITDLRDLKTDHWIIDPTRFFGRRNRNESFCPVVLNFKQVGTSYEDFRYMKIHIFALRWKDEIKRSSQLRLIALLL